MVEVEERGGPGELDSIYRPEKEFQSIDQANPRFRFGSGRKWTKWTNVVVHKASPPQTATEGRMAKVLLDLVHYSAGAGEEGRAIPLDSVDK